MALRWDAPTSSLPRYLELEAAASSPFCAFVYDDEAATRRFHTALVEAGVGEFAAPWGRLALDDDGEPAGMLAAVPGKLLAGVRFKAAALLAKLPAFTPELRARMAASRAALVAVGADDAYLSRIAVAPAARGRGLGAALLEAFLDDARAAGARRAVLEVSPAHVAARALYRRFGFAGDGVHEAADPHSARRLSYEHLHKPL
jgi:ribosomal protein S18 acetylase RimI-like enzyme